MNRLLTIGIAAAPALLRAQSAGTLTVHLDRPLHPMAKGFYGLMTEEINHSYDGGLYGELVANRAQLDDPRGLARWTGIGGELDLREVAIPGTVLHRAFALPSAGGVANEGYWGIPVRPKTAYRGSLWVKGSGPFTVSLESRDGATIYAKAQVCASADWRRVEFTLKTGDEAPTSAANRLAVRTTDPIQVAGLSLFGPTYKNRPNGNRPDLMELLAGMRPSFLRFPGGNYLEGNTIADWFDWKKTLGPVDARPGHQAPWGYRSSDGLGLLEFLNWCEDLKMKPLLAVFAGYTLNGQHIEPGAALASYVQEALDEIEFVTGDPKTTKWGAERARLGHPKPFPLEYVEIGNEDWFDRSGSYEGRFAQLYDAIKAKYPRLQLIASAAVKSRRPDLLDDHYYRTAAEMARDSDHYRKADRSGPKVFVGEWASLQGQPTPDFQAALGDAVWLTGLETDSDHVLMEAYAPLLTNLNPGASQWNTNLIGYDALRSFGSPGYWVQALFAANTGDTVLPVEVVQGKASEAFPFRGGIGVAAVGGEAEFRDVTLEGRTVPGFAEWTKGRGWTVADGILRGAGPGRGSRAVTIDPAWSDFTLRLKARRLGDGSLGVVFHALDDHNLWQWNVGGPTNALLHTQVFDTRPVGRGETVALPSGEWADLRLEVRSGHVRGYVNDRLAIEADEAPPAIPTLYASATRAGRETILKVVNLSDTASSVRLDLLGGAKRFALSGQSMTGPLWGQNTLDEPRRIAPQPLPKATLKPGDAYTFAPAR